MSNQNNDNSPPQPTQNIDGKPNTERAIGTASAAGIDHGGVGNTTINAVEVQASSDVAEPPATTETQAGQESVGQHGVTQEDTGLHAACIAGDVDRVKRLLDLGQVDVNNRGGGGWTPVMEAAYQGHRRMVEFLLSRGADVSLVDENGSNTLHYACMGGDVGTVEFLLSKEHVNCRRGWRNMTPVMWAAFEGHRGVVEFLVRRGEAVSLVDVDVDGNNSLHYACDGGDVGTVQFLLSVMEVVNVNARNNKGKTPADVARDEGHHQLLDLL